MVDFDNQINQRPLAIQFSSRLGVSDERGERNSFHVGFLNAFGYKQAFAQFGLLSNGSEEEHQEALPSFGLQPG